MAIHEFRKRYGRKIIAQKLKFHPKIAEYMDYIRKKGSKNNEIDHNTITTILAYEKAKMPMDYIDFIAHTITEANSLEEDALAPYARSFRRLCRSNGFFSAAEERVGVLIGGKAPTVFRNLVNLDFLKGVRGVVKKSRKPISTFDIAKALSLEQSKFNTQHITYALNVFDALGKINKLPIDSTKGAHSNTLYIDASRPMPVPDYNLGYSIMKALLPGSKKPMEIVLSPELKGFAVSKPRKTSSMKNVLKTGIVSTALKHLVDEQLVTFEYTPHAKGNKFQYMLTPEGKRHLTKTTRSQVLTEDFRRRLIGTKQYTISNIDLARVKKIERWARVMMADEIVTKMNGTPRKKGTQLTLLARALREKESYVQNAIAQKHVPSEIAKSLPERLGMYVTHVDDLETKAWLWKWLKKEARI